MPGMVKVCSPGDWGLDIPPVAMIKVSMRGLIGKDLDDLIKRAGGMFAHEIRNMEIKPDELPIHAIGLGSTEGYGPNRNGDGFKEATGISYHPTFVKHARWYRNHKNKDPRKSYGYIKHSAYNKDMRRVELLAMLNKTKEAARRNGGLVADQEMEKVEHGDDIPVSMACKIAYDVCASCGNKAASRAEYCLGIDEGGKCPTGGCRHNLCKVASNGFQNHVDNPHPLWFDLSNVGFQADRIAYGAVADYLQKAASAGVVGGAALAEHLGVTAPIDVVLAELGLRQDIADMIKAGHALAELEPTAIPIGVSNAYKLGFQVGQIDLSPLKPLQTEQMKLALAALANEKIALSAADFVRLLAGDDHAKLAEMIVDVEAKLPGIYGRMIEDGDLMKRAANNPWQPAKAKPTHELSKWAARFAESHSLASNRVIKRAQLHSIFEETRVKIACAAGQTPDELSEEIARNYAMYKVGFLSIQPNLGSDVQLTNMLVLLHH